MHTAPTSPRHDATLPELTSLRFFAAFAVLLLHYRDLLGPLPPPLLKAIVGGQYGVTFFFVLSGFILTFKYHDWFAQRVQEGRYWRFQRLRFARIYPIYLVGLLLDTPWHLAERLQSGQLADSAHEYWASWLLNLVGLQAWVPGVPYAMFWNTPAWSVSAEFFFYATFPFLCSALVRRIHSSAWLLGSLAAVVPIDTALYAAVLYLLTYSLQAAPGTQYLVLVYNPLLRYGAFFAGCLAGIWFVRLRDGTSVVERATAGAARRNAWLCASLLLIAVRVMMPDYTGTSAALWLLDVAIKYPCYILPFATIVVALASGPTGFSASLRAPWLVLLGEASYSLYIIHWSGQTFLRMGYLGSLGTPAVHLAFLLGTIGLSVLYKVVEVPWRRRLRGEVQ